MPNPGVQSQFIARSGSNTVPGRISPRLVQQLAAGLEHPGRVHRADGVQQLADPRAQQRDRSLLRSRHQRRRPDREGQGCGSSAPTASSSTRWRSRNFQFDQTFDTKLWNAVGKVHLPGQPEEQADRLLPVGPEGAAEPPAVRDLYLRVAGADLQAGLGQLGLQGRMEQHRQRQAVSRSALRRLRLLLPADHQQHRQLLLARHRPPGARKARTRSSSSIAIASSTPGAATYFLDTAKGSHTFKMGARVAEGAVVGRLRCAAAAATSSTSTTTASSTPGDLRLPDRDRRRLAERARLPDLAGGARSDRRVHERHVGGRPSDDQRRRPLRSLQGLAAGAGAARRRTQSVPVVVPAARRSPRPTSSPGTSSRRASAWSTTCPATARPCSRPTTASTGTTRASRSAATPTRTPPTSRRPTPGSTSTAIAAGSRVKRPRRHRRRPRGHDRHRSEHQGPLHARSQRVDRAAADRHDGRARRLRLQDRRRPDCDLPAGPRPRAFTVPYTFTDIGVDGRAGTADDRTPDVLRHSRPRQAAQLPDHADRA